MPNYKRHSRWATKKEEIVAVRCKGETGASNQFQGCGYSSKLTDAQINKATIHGTIPLAVVDSGATTTCMKKMHEQLQASECGGYK